MFYKCSYLNMVIEDVYFCLFCEEDGKWFYGVFFGVFSYFRRRFVRNSLVVGRR